MSKRLKAWLRGFKVGVSRDECRREIVAAKLTYDERVEVCDELSKQILLTEPETAKAMSESRASGNRSIKVCVEKEINGHVVVLNGYVRINEPRKPIKPEHKEKTNGI